MNSGNYLQARQQWMIELKDDHDDKEALAGKEAAEKEYINQQAISMRNKTLAGELQEAINTGIDINEKLVEWKRPLDVDSSQFFRIETARLFPFYKSKVENLIKSNKSLAATLYMNTSGVLFGEKYMKSTNTLKRQVKAVGVAKCKTYSKKGKDKYYWQRFVYRYCKFFGVNTKFKKIKRKLQKDFYTLRTPSIHLVPNDYHLRLLLSNQIEKSFKESAWYIPHGQKDMFLKMTGSYNLAKDTTKKERIHQYEEVIHYEAWDDVEREKSVPYNAIELVCSKDSSKCEQAKVTKYRQVKYKSREKVKKTRTEERELTYPVYVTSQELKINLEGALKKDEQEYAIIVKDNLNEVDFYHRTSMPHIGLNTKDSKLIRPQTWVNKQVSSFGNKIKTQLNSLWEEKYCSQDNSQNILLDGENHLRCALVASIDKYPDIEKWFQGNFRLGMKDVTSLLGTL